MYKTLPNTTAKKMLTNWSSPLVLRPGTIKALASTKPWASGMLSKQVHLNNSCSTSFAISQWLMLLASLTSNLPNKKTSPACAEEVFFRLWFC